MEFCCKFNGSMKFQTILFGLLLSLSILDGAESNCNYYQEMESGQTYYVYNEEYPYYYQGENHCIWQMRSSYNIRINCHIEMDTCYKNRLYFNFSNGYEVYYCETTDITLSGPTPSYIQLDSSYDSEGRFLCSIETENDNYCDCGWKKVTKIVGGEETGVNEYPMMAGLVDTGIKELYCGATIISNQYVLTAAHCVDGRKINNIKIVVGEHDVTTGTETKATKLFAVYGCIIHPQYNPRGDAENDIAICKINGTIIFNDSVGPACLPFRYSSDLFQYKTVTALGWGTLEFGGRKSNTLQKVNLNITNTKKCQENYPDTASYSNSCMCTYTPGKDSCQMDSGGPLLWQDPKTSRLVLVGIISSGIGCAGDYPSISERVGAYMDWIESNTPDAQYCTIT